MHEIGFRLATKRMTARDILLHLLDDVDRFMSHESGDLFLSPPFYRPEREKVNTITLSANEMMKRSVCVFGGEQITRFFDTEPLHFLLENALIEA